MTSSKSTKRALLTSVLALLMCVTMLIGATFAWFTDTASTAVNKIQAGTLNVDIVDKNGDSLDGKSLSFKDVNNNTDILWEPGATFNLDSFKIVNKGNLAFKYKVIISGVNGNAKLLEAIDFFVKIGNAEKVALADWDGILLPEGKTATTDNEVAGATDLITISGTMKKEAGNEYQGLSIDGIGITVVATQDTVEYDSIDNQYDQNAEYPTITTGATLNEVFGGANIDFGYGNTSTESVTLDGKGVAVVSDWTDAWVNSDTTIKGVTFMNGAVFSANTDNVTITLENCTFYACDQSKLTYTGNNSLTNSGAGMCLNLEKSSHQGVKFIVKNCTFVGENDNSLPVDGPRYNGDGTINGMKKRGHAIALDAICGGGTGTLDSLLIEGCVINGVRGNAIQLYGNTGDITIKDTKINSWAMNNSGVGFAIRGDYPATGRTLTIQNVYFGLNEQTGNSDFGHVKVGSFSGNTDGTETAGTYSK